MTVADQSSQQQQTKKTVEYFLSSSILLVLSLSTFFFIYVRFDQPSAARLSRDGGSSFYLSWQANEPPDDLIDYSLGGLIDGTSGGRDYRYVKSTSPRVAPAARKPPVASSGSIAGSPGDLMSRPMSEALGKAIELVDKGQAEAAIPILEEHLARNPNDVQALVELGMIYMIDLKQPGDALGYLQKALVVNPGDDIVAAEVIGLYSELGQADQGMSFIGDLYKKNPGSASLAMGMGQMLASSGRDNEAVEYFEKAIASQQANGPKGRGSMSVQSAYRELAETYKRQGQSDKALEVQRSEIGVLEQEAANAPNSRIKRDRLIRSVVGLAYDLISQGRFDEAEKVLKRGQSKVGQDNEIASLLADIRFKKG